MLFFKNFQLKTQLYISKNSARVNSFLMLSKMFSFIFLFAILPADNKIDNSNISETRIKFNQESPSPLSINDKVVRVESGGSREDLANLDPDAIKGLMKVYGEQYGVDWRLVYAIGYHESGNYNSSLARNQYNFFGRKAGSGGYASWSNPEEAIQNQFEYLKTRYFDRGMDTPQEINPVYAEDNSWYWAVEQVMNQL